MLASVVLTLERLEGERVGRAESGEAARGWFYECLAAQNPELGRAVHAAQGPAPFTVSFLIRDEGQGTGGGGQHSPDAHTPFFRLRFTMLTREVFTALSEHLFARYRDGEAMRLGRETFRVVRIALQEESDPSPNPSRKGRGVETSPSPSFARRGVVGWAQLSAFEELWGGAAGRRLEFEFTSPTTFRVGEGNLPLPVPMSVFRSAWEKWNAFAPAPLRMERGVLDAVERHVFPAAHVLRTQTVSLSRGKVVGFIGRCAFEVIGRMSDDALRQLSALTRFAFFSGIGARTTMGLGQTRTQVVEG